VNQSIGMRILYDHQAFSLQSHGGITRVFSEIIRYMNTQRNVSTDVLLGFSGTHTDFGALVSPLGQVIHPGRELFKRSILNYAANETFSTLAGPLLGKYDIYHSTYYRFLPAIRAKHRVATHHDCVQEMFPHLFPNSRRIYLWKRKMYFKADLILCVSAASRTDLLRFYDIAEEKAVVVHNGVSQMVREPHGESELRGVVSGEFLLYVGARHSYKNFDGLLRAYAASDVKQNYSLVALGGGPPNAAHSLLIEQLNLTERVKFVPYASIALLAEAYASAALLVYPSLYEGFGLPPLEAASLGCVSLVAANPATREICQDAAFFFDPAATEYFSSMLQVALTDTAGRSMRIQHARDLLKIYTWEACGRRTLEAYQRLQ
jgi:glycosyltransferase involved in cell wall biosynthesis